ncbi:MAG TPA: glutathione S-transferase family protein [Stellaceae bacterium]|nr:glutathione S-transferase family protein [Stellaceae bacterium]
MAELTLYIGNKNYSSWSLRPWLTLKGAGIAFDEVVVPLYRPESKRAILDFSPSGKVPALRHGDLLVWDSLSICEYLAEAFPQAHLWPQDAAARAAARSACAEMHSGFAALRAQLPMNVRAHLPGRALSPEVAAEIGRIAALWRECRTRFGNGKGDFLFGRFTIADAMYAPVASRFRTYRVALPPDAQAYCERLLASAPMQEWAEAARAEPWRVAAFEL